MTLVTHSFEVRSAEARPLIVDLLAHAVAERVLLKALVSPES